MTTEDLPGGSQSRRARSVIASPSVRDDEIASVRDVTFPVALRGYDREAVDAYVREVNRIIAELQVGRSPQSAIRHALDQVSEETRGILEEAHETADEITARSRSKADDRLQRAEREAKEAIEAAEKRVHTLDADAESVWQERRRLIEDVQRVSTELAALAEEAKGRFPGEPESDTAPLPVPPPPPDDELPDDAGAPPAPAVPALGDPELPGEPAASVRPDGNGPTEPFDIEEAPDTEEEAPLVPPPPPPPPVEKRGA
jgi:DivIVA domain-containing protein